MQRAAVAALRGVGARRGLAWAVLRRGPGPGAGMAWVPPPPRPTVLAVCVRGAALLAPAGGSWLAARAAACEAARPWAADAAATAAAAAADAWRARSHLWAIPITRTAFLRPAGRLAWGLHRWLSLSGNRPPVRPWAGAAQWLARALGAAFRVVHLTWIFGPVRPAAGG